eukprot:2921579-Lingulodinium_polyedra.AAC.1
MGPQGCAAWALKAHVMAPRQVHLWTEKLDMPEGLPFQVKGPQGRQVHTPMELADHSAGKWLHYWKAADHD